MQIRRADKYVALALLGIVVVGVVLAVLDRGPGPVTVERGLAYAAPGGEPLLLDAYFPDDDRTTEDGSRRPGVVLVHGGGWTGGSREDVAALANDFALQGWVALSIDYRLAAPRFPAQVDDVATAVRCMRAHAAELGVDPARLALFGFSSGGNLAGLAATRGEGPLDVDDRVAVWAGWSGQYDLPRLTPDADGAIADCNEVCEGFWSSGALLDEYLGCAYDECPQQYDAASPVTRLDPTDPPVAIANATDELTPISQVDAMAAALDGANVVHEVTVVPGSAHAQGLDGAWPATITFLAAGLDEPAPEFPVLSDGARAVLVAVLLGVIVLPVCFVMSRARTRRTARSTP